MHGTTRLASAKSRFAELSRQRQAALSIWENEGGARLDSKRSTSRRSKPAAPPLTNTELVQLHIRVIALENLVIALLAESTGRELAREMAAYISPRPGYTPHPLTIHAATQMLHLVERADHFRSCDG